jgi:eukaryotic-like serine/threonine-protein kinase
VSTSGANRRFGKYEILRRLGSDKAGRVFLALDTALDRQVALRIVGQNLQKDPDAAARLLQQVKAVASLTHPNIVVIYDFGLHEGYLFAAMEVLPGESLRAAIEKKPALSLVQRLEIAMAIAKALEHANSRGVLLHDFRPGSIQLLSGEDVKVIDFGISPVEPREGAQGAGLVNLGPYSSPEEVLGLPATVVSNVFSFGVVLYELLSYRKPFSGADAAELRLKIAFEEPPAFDPTHLWIPPALQLLVFRCLAKKPEQRFESFEPIVAELRRLAHGPALELPARGSPGSVADRPEPSQEGGGEEVIFDETEASAPSTALSDLSESAVGEPIRVGSTAASPRGSLPEAREASTAPWTFKVPGKPPSEPAAPEVKPIEELPGGASKSFFLMLLLGAAAVAASLLLATSLTPWLLNKEEPQANSKVFFISTVATNTPALDARAAASATPPSRPLRPDQPAKPLSAAPPPHKEPSHEAAAPEHAIERAPEASLPTPTSIPMQTLPPAQDASVSVSGPQVQTAAAEPTLLEAQPTPVPTAPAFPTPMAPRPKAPPALPPTRKADRRPSPASRTTAPAAPTPTQQPAASPTLQATAEPKPSAIPSSPTSPAAPSLETPRLASEPDLAPSPARAAAEPTAQIPDRTAENRRKIDELLARYKAASEALDTDALRVIWPSLKGKRLKVMEDVFSGYASQRLTINVNRVDIDFGGDTGAVFVTIKRVIQPKEGDRVTEEHTVKIAVRRSGNQWVIAD